MKIYRMYRLGTLQDRIVKRLGAIQKTISNCLAYVGGFVIDGYDLIISGQ